MGESMLMKVWLMMLFLNDDGAARRYINDYSTQRSCEFELKHIIKTNSNVRYGYCLEVFGPR